MRAGARYHDGRTAAVHDVDVFISPGAVTILERETSDVISVWDKAKVYPVYSSEGHLRIGTEEMSSGARLIFTGRHVDAVRAALPALARHRMMRKRQQMRIAGFGTLALVSVVAGYIFGIPLLAERLVAAMPPEWEEQVGETVADQIEVSFAGSEGGVFERCDPDPDSLANRAIRRFTDEVMSQGSTPFRVDVAVMRSDIPNAIALPGGQVYYFSALLEETRTADEFAGVLAHELGHVEHRHGMEQLISTAGTGALIGFILGDLTGASVAAGIGSAMIDTRFSREAEREADRFSAAAAGRLGYNPAAFADLLDRVSQEDGYGSAFALLSTHPLTTERRETLQALAEEENEATAPFTKSEWRAIRAMCSTGSDAP
ncbi:metalloendopeptidase [Devosia pacifica]|uniref:Metalloendopeptidase n=1 Tax=Devosia pacifica TaxID=1335967 RepID=A0A918SB54_9HYPH|nr:M48 family metallopeptidase [Devosia pacifica]GHA30119.1 metalloendopeptidase [Devosia pacifica]